MERVNAAEARRGSWVTVLGEAGIGKTALAGELGRRVSAAGGRQVVGRCSTVDRTTPYRPLAEALMAAARRVERPGRADGLGPYLPAVERFLPHWRTSGSDVAAPDSPAVTGESLLRVLSWLARGRCLAMVLEDLHWADAGTEAVCDYLVDHLDGTPLLVVATARDRETAPATLALLRRAATVAVPPLAPDEVVRVAAGCLGHEPSPAVVERLHRDAAGLPLLVEDLLGDEGASRFEDLVRGRVVWLSDDGRRAVVAAALAGERFEPAGAIDEAVAAQLVVADGGSFRFRHALTRDAVLGAAPALAAALTPSVAAALEERGRDDDLVRAAELWEEAGEAGRSAALLVRAAGVAGRCGAPSTALDLLERAAGLAPDAGTRTDVALARLDLLVAHGHADEAVAVGESLLDTGTDHQPVHRAMARALLDGGRVPEALAHLDAASGGAELLVLRARAALASATADRRITAEHLAHQAVAAAEAEDNLAAACEALDVVARCARNRSLADAESALQRALVIAERSERPALRLRALNELGTVEMLRSADGSRLGRARRQALDAGALDVATGIDVNIAALHAMRGELEEARTVGEGAEAAARRLGIRPLAAAALVMQALADGFRGQRDALERRLAEAEALVPGDADLRAFAWGAGRGLCALVREERDEAIRCFERAIQPDPPIGSLDIAHGPLLLVRAVTGRATGADLDAARATATPGAGWSDLWLGYGEAAFGNGPPGLFEAADEAARRHPLFRAIGLRLLAEAALRGGWGEPVQWLRDAEAVFVVGGQARIATACRDLLRKAGAPATRRRGGDRAVPAGLLRSRVTLREAEVLELIGARLGNNEIAARLFLSPRTVEKHVASLLVKLGAADRAALVGHTVRAT